MPLVKTVVSSVAAVAIAAVVAGCATSPSAYRDRDEPINRTTGVGQDYYTGTVTRVDEPQQVVVLDNGRMYRVSGDRAVIVNGQPMVLGNVQVRTPAGQSVEFRPPAGTVVRKGDPVAIDMQFGGPAPSALPR